MEKDNIIDKRDDEPDVKIDCKESDNKDKVANSFISKIKQVKHKEIIIAILVILVCLVAYTFYVSSDKEPDKNVDIGSRTLTSELEEMLGYISGVGDVKLIIVYNGGDSLEIASTIDKTTTSVEEDGRVTVTVDEMSSPVLDDSGNPLVIGETRAEIEGVLVVCEGGDDPKVRVEIMSALANLLNVKYDSINVLDME